MADKIRDYITFLPFHLFTILPWEYPLPLTLLHFVL